MSATGSVARRFQKRYHFSMKIVVATPLYPPEIGGPSTYAKLLAEGLPARGVEVTLVKFGAVRHLPKLVRHLAYFARVRRALKRADLVLALDPVSVGLPACLAARSLQKPLVVKVVGDYAWEQGRQRFGVEQVLDEFVRTKQASLRVRLLQAVQTRVARCAKRIIVPSVYLEGVVAAWGIPRDGIRVIYNAVSREKFGVIPANVAKLPRPLVVTAGRLVPWKHVDGVIDAVASIPEASLAIVGDGPLRAALTRRAGERLPGRALFTGTLSHADTLAVVKSADAFALNSSYEGLSHLLIEARMLGVPIVATKVGGNPEVVADGEDGLLIPEGDTPALARSIARVLGDDEFRARCTARARESERRFEVETMLAATATLLQSI